MGSRTDGDAVGIVRRAPRTPAVPQGQPWGKMSLHISTKCMGPMHVHSAVWGSLVLQTGPAHRVAHWPEGAQPPRWLNILLITLSLEQQPPSASAVSSGADAPQSWEPMFPWETIPRARQQVGLQVAGRCGYEALVALKTEGTFWWPGCDPGMGQGCDRLG